MRLAVIVGALLSVLISSAVARADRPDASALRAIGVNMSWPVGRNAVWMPNSTVVVKVTSAKRRVRLSLVALDRTGKAVHAIARKTLRTGTFRARLGGSGAYALRVRVAGQSYASVITVPGPFVDAPEGSALPPAWCFGNTTGTTAAMSLDVTAVTAGSTLPYHLINTSDGCETVGPGYDIEQLQPDGTFTTVTPGETSGPGGMPLSPSRTFAKRAQLPADLPPGTYQLRDFVNGQPDPAGNPSGQLWMTAPFTIVAGSAATGVASVTPTRGGVSRVFYLHLSM